ncbi:hypothetical protein T03_11038 [Trichinella britovi]|uniref:Uncharacterized protein n=1 Tax=Trichinella britovi TaxID=45882 RepID=A0A0V1CBT8_TRIBR|nr:hypothetical protein T03_11038 [Trichinella britovi]
MGMFLKNLLNRTRNNTTTSKPSLHCDMHPGHVALAVLVKYPSCKLFLHPCQTEFSLLCTQPRRLQSIVSPLAALRRGETRVLTTVFRFLDSWDIRPKAFDAHSIFKLQMIATTNGRLVSFSDLTAQVALGRWK